MGQQHFAVGSLIQAFVLVFVPAIALVRALAFVPAAHHLMLAQDVCFAALEIAH